MHSASPLSPLNIVNRGAVLLARYVWWFLVVILIFEILPTETAQYSLLKPIFAHHVASRAEIYIRIGANFFCAFTLDTFRSPISCRMILDDEEGHYRGFWHSVLTGVVMFGRTFWWRIPLSALSYWLTYHTFFLPGLVLSYLLCVFVPYLVVDRHTYAESWRAAWTMARRHSPLLLLNVLLMLGAYFAIYSAYTAVIRDWQQHSTLELRTIVYIPLWTIVSAIFSAWNISFYISIRECLRAGPQQVAAIFE